MDILNNNTKKNTYNRYNTNTNIRNKYIRNKYLMMHNNNTYNQCIVK